MYLARLPGGYQIELICTSTSTGELSDYLIWRELMEGWDEALSSRERLKYFAVRTG